MPRDYSSWLRQRGSKRHIVKRTEKRPGDIEIVYRDGQWVPYRHGEAAA